MSSADINKLAHLYSHFREAEDDLTVNVSLHEMEWTPTAAERKTASALLSALPLAPGAACKAVLASHGTYLPHATACN